MQIQEVKTDVLSGRTAAKSKKDSGQGSFMEILKKAEVSHKAERPYKTEKTRSTEQPEKYEKPDHTERSSQKKDLIQSEAAQQMAGEAIQEKPGQEMNAQQAQDVKAHNEPAGESVAQGVSESGDPGAVSVQQDLWSSIMAETAAGKIPADGTVTQMKIAEAGQSIQEMVPAAGEMKALDQAQTAGITEAAHYSAEEAVQEAGQSDETVQKLMDLLRDAQKDLPNPKEMPKMSDLPKLKETEGFKGDGSMRLYAERASKGSAQQSESEYAQTAESGQQGSLKELTQIWKQSYRSAGKVQDEKDSQVNVEKLQKDVDRNVFLNNGQIAFQKLSGGYRTEGIQNAATAQVSVTKQVQTGIEQGIQRGQQSFSIMLKPEGLGEVIVHMASVGGKIAMSIGVSSQETQKLISSEMAQLKEVLQPLNAEVKEIYQSQEGGMDMMAYQQSFYQQQRQQLYERIHFSGTAFHQGGEVSAEESVQQAAAVPQAVSGGLNAYI